MKFCFVMPFHILEQKGGGAEVQAWLLAKELARRGHQVYYITQAVKKHGKKEEFKDGVNILWLRYKRHFDWRNMHKFFSSLKKVDPDIVIQRMASFTTGVIGFYCKKYRKKFIWICTDNQSCQKWNFIRSQLIANKNCNPNLAKKFLFLINAFICDISRNFGMKQIAFAFTLNDIQRDRLFESFNIESLRYISGHEIKEEIIQFKSKLKKSIVLWVGNLGPNKRPEKFIDLANIAQQSSYQFIMIGNKIARGYTDKLFQSKPDSLSWLGRLSFEETLGWFDRALFFINTSSSEGFPNTFIQSWIRGVPIITLGVDPDSMIKKHLLGFVEETVDSVLNRMDYLRENVKEYKHISKNVWQYARENHSIKKSCDVFLNNILDITIC